ncbi:HD-GYP domain-containing protein [Parashewanella spongiae]|uniref:HD-GYP domain-containing protein n=2 Tax=Parashewanella spongiae TaxID=342950 RepID=A0A3A6TD80_9GAMM|nr:HD-GYP domain-containing protein [Parashewanella spongiae]RJY10707.1 HD-GYP domain-containing protein [Parashewanella spongiae]
MFVSQIEDRNNTITISNPGQIRSREDIIKLKRNGVLNTWVNALRSDPSCGLPIPKHAQPEAQTSTVIEPLTRTQKQDKSKELLGEAKDLLRKVLSETFEGKAIEVSPFEDLADNMLESVMGDPDALRCMSALRSKDAYLLEHSINVAFLLITFGEHLKLDKSILKQFAIGGLLHDVGKIYIDDKILHKPSKLTDDEFIQMKGHQQHAIEIMKQTTGLSQISKDVCLMHHEKLDGTGYPYGLKGEQLPHHGRMSCIIDIYDALTATRCYKEAMSPAAAFKILLKLTPFHLDKALVYEFIRCIGVYPTGSLVELSDSRVGIVWESKGRDALHPIVKCFYSLKYKHYLEITYVDLLTADVNIERGISPSSLDVDPSPFY